MTTMGSDNKPLLPNGLPDMSKENKSSHTMLAMLFFVPMLVCCAIAYAIYYFGSTDKYNAKIDAVKADDMQWVYAALIVFSRTVVLLNLFPMTYKQRVMKKGNIRSNMFIYKAIGDDAPKNAVIMDEHGDVGAYNRSNRSIHHMVENFGAFVAGLYMVGSVFPFPAFVCTCVWCLGRVAHQIGYTTKYGGHTQGFMLSMMAQNVIEGLAVIVTLKSFGIL